MGGEIRESISHGIPLVMASLSSERTLHLIINSNLITGDTLPDILASTRLGASVLVLSRDVSKRSAAVALCLRAGISPPSVIGLARGSAATDAVAKLPRVLVIGCVDEDIHLANYAPLLWLQEQGSTTDKVKKYGTGIPRNRLAATVGIFVNAKHLWRTIEFTADAVPVTVVAVARANYYYVPGDEARVLMRAEDTLKSKLQSADVLKVLKLFMVAVLGSTRLLHEVQDWGVFPSSSASTPSEPLEQILDALRFASNNSHTRGGPLLVRHTDVSKSRKGSRDERIPAKHLESVKVSDAYDGKLGGRTVAILDDYWTSGASFEAARVLLTAQGVKKV